jgi:hypothetical protein
MYVFQVGTYVCIVSHILGCGYIHTVALPTVAVGEAGRWRLWLGLAGLGTVRTRKTDWGRPRGRNTFKIVRCGRCGIKASNMALGTSNNPPPVVGASRGSQECGICADNTGEGRGEVRHGTYLTSSTYTYLPYTYIPTLHIHTYPTHTYLPYIYLLCTHTVCANPHHIFWGFDGDRKEEGGKGGIFAPPPR